MKSGWTRAIRVRSCSYERSSGWDWAIKLAGSSKPAFFSTRYLRTIQSEYKWFLCLERQDHKHEAPSHATCHLWESSSFMDMKLSKCSQISFRTMAAERCANWYVYSYHFKSGTVYLGCRHNFKIWHNRSYQYKKKLMGGLETVIHKVALKWVSLYLIWIGKHSEKHSASNPLHRRIL